MAVVPAVRVYEPRYYEIRHTWGGTFRHCWPDGDRFVSGDGGIGAIKMSLVASATPCRCGHADDALCPAPPPSHADRQPIKVTADDIAGCLARNTFKDALVAVDRCTHTGDEADLLVVTRHGCRFIDVEVKISRADLKADRRKDKWFDFPMQWRGERPDPVPREWPRSIWKHYYAMPAGLWRPDLVEFCGTSSGVLLVTPSRRSPRWWSVTCVRRAKPSRTARSASPAECIDIARLASLRMWDAYSQLREAKEIT
jgi:hypothetical protein